MARGQKDGHGAGKGDHPGALHRNRNPEPCSDNRGMGKGKGENRK